ncbi:11914_t:CDS:2 [Acaulospora colombiana]|uniref:11914_t:CDS:1 n=1 Tax=Acaulospora colombiana TaxID=27376 RepID=A0ACA9P8S9_9GLOM|nr:11914_t:CDS:2 [Acaulospora colombiana]
MKVAVSCVRPGEPVGEETLLTSIESEFLARYFDEADLVDVVLVVVLVLVRELVVDELDLVDDDEVAVVVGCSMVKGGHKIGIKAQERKSTHNHSMDDRSVRYHRYLSPWGITSNQAAWGAQWITDHANVQKSVGKPVLIEEYGLTESGRVPMLYGGTPSRPLDLLVSSIGKLERLLVDPDITMDMLSCENYQLSFRTLDSPFTPSSTSDSMFSALKTHYAKLKART